MDSKGPDKSVDHNLDFDNVLKSVGSKGKYQRNMLYIILVPLCFCLGFNQCQLLFQVAVPKHWCHVPGRENTTYSREEWIDLTIPKVNDTGKYSSCSRYELYWTQNGNKTFDITNETQECADGWDFEQNQFWSTVATSFQWFCEKEINSPYILTSNMAGNTVGTLVFPIVADVIGRRSMFYVLLGIHVVSTLAYIWINLYGLHMAFRFIRGLVEMSVYYIPHVTVMEILDPEDRAKATSVSWVWWVFGMCITSLVAWLVPNWQYLALISIIPGLLGFLYWKYLPESPRWLLSKGKVRECAKILMKIGKTNGQKCINQRELESKLSIIASQREEKVSFLEVCKYPKLRLRAIMIFIMSPCTYLVHGIVLFGISVLPDNQFMSHFILSISELPSHGLGLLLTHFLGRRVTCYITFTLTALCCLMSAFCIHSRWLMMVMASLTKLFNTTSLYVMYILNAEIFPTAIRSSGMGTMGVTGLAAMALAPSIMNSDLGPSFQYWVMFSLSIIGLLTSLPMPETLGLPLPQTFQEAEHIDFGRPITTWIHHWNYQKFPIRRYSLPDQSVYTEEMERLRS